MSLFDRPIDQRKRIHHGDHSIDQVARKHPSWKQIRKEKKGKIHTFAKVERNILEEII